ncbi:MAG: transcriptional repressor [Marinosulfonomonas sp.]|nr:transcriptional repressor [Marinosulfonomonas sp.]
MKNNAGPAKAFADHNHQHCCGEVLDHAQKLATGAGLRLTPVRRRTLEILLEEHRALGAYEVLERLAEDGFGKQPPVAYRALEFLVENGLAHRIRRLNAFAACMTPGKPHAPAFFICEVCNGVAEVQDASVRQAVDAAAAAIGFGVSRANVEVVGTCPVCREGRDQ